MASSALVSNPAIEEGEIDRDRIVDDHLVPDEYFCPICQYILWKPRSCASCQHLFCEKCIRIWIENTSSANKCPFRCEPFQDRRCPQYVQSLLARLNIRCRNSSFGCKQILSYDTLEHHENVECKYLTQRCSECEKAVLRSKLDEHQQSPGLCIPQPIKCTICQNYIQKSLFREHFHDCCQKKINELIEGRSPHQTLQITENGQLGPPNPGMAFVQSIVNTIQLLEQQKQMSRLPTNLKGVDEVRRAREQNCGHIYHILIMFKFILMNWSKAPFFIFLIATGSFMVIGAIIIGAFSIFLNWAYTHVYRGPFFIFLFSYLLTYGTSIFFQFVSDRTIIFCFGAFIFLIGCSSRTPLEVHEMNILINKPMLNIIFCCVEIFLMKIILLLIRLYFWSMATYVAAGLVAFVNFYLAFKIHRVFTNTIATTTATNQPIMTV